MPLPGMTPELEARCRDLAMWWAETFFRWYRKESKDPKLRMELTAILDEIRSGKITPAELGDSWVVMAAGKFDEIARSEKDTIRARFGLLPTERTQ